MDNISSCAYKLDLPPTTSIHPVFRVSQLKLVVFNPKDVVSLLLLALPTTCLKPMAILDRRIVKRGNVAAT